jgi:hypothetical protein
VDEVGEADLLTVLNVTADSKPTEVFPNIFVGGFKAAATEAKNHTDVVVLNCAGKRLHKFMPKTGLVTKRS